MAILCGTDFSEASNEALEVASRLAARLKVTLHLAHALDVPAEARSNAPHDPMDPYDIFGPSKGGSAAHQAARAQLAELVPKDFGGAAATTRLHVLEAKKPHTAICQAAERLGVDLICLGTHGRTGVVRTLLGSVASAVLANTTRPVLLARTPKQ